MKVAILVVLCAGLLAQGPAPEKPAASAAEEAKPAEPRRTDLNLLGSTDTDKGESRRNENVQFNLVDNNALKEMNVRLGATATIINDFKLELGYFGTEYGAPTVSGIHAPDARRTSLHGNLFWNHSNSVFAARSFFQVGSVRPAHENVFGGRIGAPLWKGGFFTGSGSRNSIRGNVNGNVLIPLPEERTPLTRDPQLAAIVQRFLNAYPAEAPNRPDIAARAHNTNSLQRIDTDSSSAQLDQNAGARDRFIFLYAYTNQSIQAFQLVTGQNPDTETQSHKARITWNRTWSARTITSATAGFDRLISQLTPAKGALGPIMISNALTTLGPSPPIPINRTINRYRYGAQLEHVAGRHTLTTGAAATRMQYNGEETDAFRGITSFGNDFGRDAITNFRLGTPSFYERAIGTAYRGYRNWNSVLYGGDHWRATQRLTVDLGLRYEPFTRPVDVTKRSDLPFQSDLNNWGPRVALAYQLPRNLGVVRSAYALLFGEIFPVTYGHERLNPPNSIRTYVPAPDLRDPFAGIDIGNLDPNTPSTRVELSPDLTTPYSHHYNASWEVALPARWNLQLAYVGSRTHKLFLTYFLNRARFVEGIPYTSATINQRRIDPTKYDRLFIHNGSRAWYDAARVSLITPRWRGLTLNASYWFSKSMDIGGNYTNTSSPPDARSAVAQTEDLSQPDLKALSTFDQPHAFLVQASWQAPRMDSAPGWIRGAFGSWILAGVGLMKSGTPFSIIAGSDAPGYGNVDGIRNDRPIVLDPTVLGRTIGHPDDSLRLLPRSAFRYIQSPIEVRGNLGRSTFRKGRIANLNASLWKEWPVDNRWRVMLRAESINFTNTPQFAEPGLELTSPNFGQINNTLNDGRAFRFLLQVSF